MLHRRYPIPATDETYLTAKPVIAMHVRKVRHFHVPRAVQKELVFLCCAFFLLSMCEVRGVPSSFALGALIALLPDKKKSAAAVVGVAAGIGLRILWGKFCDWGQLMACLFLCVLPFFDKPKHMGKNVLFFTLAFFLRVCPHLLMGQPVSIFIGFLFSYAFALLCMPVFMRLGALMQKTGTHGRETVYDLIILVCLFAVSLSKMQVFWMNLGYFFASIACLLLAGVTSAGMGACFGAAMGAALCLGGISTNCAFVLCLCSTLCALSDVQSRSVRSLLYILCIVFGTLILRLEQSVLLYIETALIAIGYLLIPVNAENALRTFLSTLFPPHAERSFYYIESAIRRWADCVRELSAALPKKPLGADEPAQYSAQAEAIADIVCSGCDKMNICWNEQFEKTQAAFTSALSSPCPADTVSERTKQVFPFCDRTTALACQLSTFYTKKQVDEEKRRGAVALRDMLESQLGMVSLTLGELLDYTARPEHDTDDLLKEKLDAILKELHCSAVLLYARYLEGHATFMLENHSSVQKKGRLTYLKREIGRRLCLSLNAEEYVSGRILFEETGEIDFDFGSAGVYADPDGSETEQPIQNGDSSICRFLSKGKYLIALSDGMGHGKTAHMLSEKTLQLLSCLLCAGYPAERALAAVNSMILATGGGERFATLDLCLVDLWSAQVKQYKLGACGTLLFRGQKADLLSGQNLPLGVMSHVIPACHEYKIAENDTLLLFSDGVQDVFGGDDNLTQSAYSCLSDSAQGSADALLSCALEQSGHCPEDDMTVLCLRFTARSRRAESA